MFLVDGCEYTVAISEFAYTTYTIQEASQDVIHLLRSEGSNNQDKRKRPFTNVSTAICNVGS